MMLSQNIDDEDEMAVAMKAIKALNSSVSTYFYMSSFVDLPEMTRMSRQSIIISVMQMETK